MNVGMKGDAEKTLKAEEKIMREEEEEEARATLSTAKREERQS